MEVVSDFRVDAGSRDPLAFAVGGKTDAGFATAVVEYFDASTWRAAAPMNTARMGFGLCEMGGFVFATGG